MSTDTKLRGLAVAMATNAQDAVKIQQDFEAAVAKRGGANMRQLAAATGESEHYVTVMRGYAAQATYLTSLVNKEAQ